MKCCWATGSSLAFRNKVWCPSTSCSNRSSTCKWTENLSLKRGQSKLRKLSLSALKNRSQNLISCNRRATFMRKKRSEYSQRHQHGCVIFIRKVKRSAFSVTWVLAKLTYKEFGLQLLPGWKKHPDLSCSPARLGCWGNLKRFDSCGIKCAD